ncbi:hypothetical protein Fmac_031691 [Flemingia macrophylla]|uniref:Uncharacterized protein n=1 Tax=Flemingia macrophylla TaxID=520843 RepID=A0ABD1L2S0_9FABA
MRPPHPLLPRSAYPDSFDKTLVPQFPNTKRNAHLVLLGQLLCLRHGHSLRRNVINRLRQWRRRSRLSGGCGREGANLAALALASATSSEESRRRPIRAPTGAISLLETMMAARMPSDSSDVHVNLIKFNNDDVVTLGESVAFEFDP